MKYDNKDVSTFFSSVAACILGERIGMTLKGNVKKVEVTKQIIVASRNLLEALEDPNTTLKDIRTLIEIKRTKAQDFTANVGIAWIL